MGSGRRTWVALDADSKLVPSWYVVKRTALDALEFMRDVAARLDNRVQLTTDGYAAYLIAVDRAFGGEIDYAAPPSKSHRPCHRTPRRVPGARNLRRMRHPR